MTIHNKLLAFRRVCVAAAGLSAALVAGGALAYDAYYVSALDGSPQSCADCYCSYDDYGNQVVRSYPDGGILSPVASGTDCEGTCDGAIFTPPIGWTLVPVEDLDIFLQEHGDDVGHIIGVETTKKTAEPEPAPLSE